MACTSSEASAENDSLLLGYYNEEWLANWRKKMDDREEDLMKRFITVYYGTWPTEHPYEYKLFVTASSLFKRIEHLMAKRINLVKGLQRILIPDEYAMLFEELERVSADLVEPIYNFERVYELLDHALMHPKTVARNPEVDEYLADMNKHYEKVSNSVREDCGGMGKS